MSNPMADLADFVLKLKFQGTSDDTTQVRRVRLPRICNNQTGAVSYEELVGLAISFVIPEKPLHGSDFQVKLTYKDVDDDLVVIGSSEELLDAIDQFKDQRVLRITAEVKRTTRASGTTTSPSPRQPNVPSSRASTDEAEAESNNDGGGVSNNDAGVQTGFAKNGSRSPMLENVVESVVRIVLDAALAINGRNRGDPTTPAPPAVFYSPDGIPSGSAEATHPTDNLNEDETAAASTEKPSIEPTSEELVSPPAASAPPADEERSVPPAETNAIVPAKDPKEDAAAPTEEKKESPTQETAEAPVKDEERPFIHGRHTCDSCLTTPIIGKRYHALNMSDYDLCEKCYDTYNGGEIQFEAVELERDRHLQNRWHRRRERMNNKNNNRGHGSARGFGPRPHHTRWNPPPPPPGPPHPPRGFGAPKPRGPPPPVHPAHRGPRGVGGLKAPPPGPPPHFASWKGRQEQKASEDDAMAMAIKLSLQDMKKKAPEPEKPQVAPSPALSPKKAPPQPSAQMETADQVETTKAESVKSAKSASTGAAAKSTATVVSKHDSAKSEQVEEKSVASTEVVEPVLVETIKETEKPAAAPKQSESTEAEGNVATESAAVQVETVEDDDNGEEEASIASDPFVVTKTFEDGSISLDLSRFKSQESVVEPPAKKDGSRESSFSSDAAGNGEIADMLGETLDKCAEAIDAMVSELDRNSFDAASSAASAVSSFVGVNEEPEAEETSATGCEEAEEAVTILESVEDALGHASDILESVEDALVHGTDDLSAEERSEEDWQVVSEDQQIGADEELARAAQMIGSALFNSDMRSSGEMMSTLTGSAAESDGMSHASSALTSVPSVNTQVADAQRQRWASQLKQLRTLGIDDDARCVDILERLTAANIGCGVSDDISVQEVINELWK